MCLLDILRSIEATGDSTKPYQFSTRIEFPRFPEKWVFVSRVRELSENYSTPPYLICEGGQETPYLIFEGGQGTIPVPYLGGGAGDDLRTLFGLKGRGGVRHHSLIPAISSSHTLHLLPPLTLTCYLFSATAVLAYLVALKVSLGGISGGAPHLSKLFSMSFLTDFCY